MKRGILGREDYVAAIYEGWRTCHENQPSKFRPFTADRTLNTGTDNFIISCVDFYQLIAEFILKRIFRDFFLNFLLECIRYFSISFSKNKEGEVDEDLDKFLHLLLPLYSSFIFFFPFLSFSSSSLILEMFKF